MLFTFYYYVKQRKDLNLHKLIKWALKNPDQKTPKISKFGVKTEKENKQVDKCFKTNPYSIKLHLNDKKSDFVFEFITAIAFGIVPLKQRNR